MVSIDGEHQVSKATSAIMKANKRVNTKPELLVRSALHRLGLRFRKDYVIKTVSRKCRPDIVFTRIKLAVFIDGCFWHLCPEHGHIPKSNSSYWETKFKKNCERDSLDTLALEDSGWNVLRIWEHISIQEATGLIISKRLTLLAATTNKGPL